MSIVHFGLKSIFDAKCTGFYTEYGNAFKHEEKLDEFGNL